MNNVYYEALWVGILWPPDWIFRFSEVRFDNRRRFFFGDNFGDDCTDPGRPSIRRHAW